MLIFKAEAALLQAAGLQRLLRGSCQATIKMERRWNAIHRKGWFHDPNAISDPSDDHATKSPGPKPSVSYWHLWTDDAGVSHQTQCALTDFVLKGVGNAEPQWNNKHGKVEATPVFTVQPVGWVGDWHENPAPQWIVVLSGRWWIESMDGTRIEQGPGQFSFGEDQGCTQDGDGRKGHRSGTIGDEPAVLMTVQLHVAAQHKPCVVP